MNELEKILQIVYKAKSFGYTKLMNGTELVGNLPQIGPDAVFHELFPPLSPEEINDLETKLNFKFPPELKKFYLYFNGMNLFSDTIYMYGKRRNYIRKGDESRQPYDILTQNIDSRLEDMTITELVIGGYGQDGSKLVIDVEKGGQRVFRRLRDSGKIIEEWPGLFVMLDSEVERIFMLFDDKGNKK